MKQNARTYLSLQILLLLTKIHTTQLHNQEIGIVSFDPVPYLKYNNKLLVLEPIRII